MSTAKKRRIAVVATSTCASITTLKIAPMMLEMGWLVGWVGVQNGDYTPGSSGKENLNVATKVDFYGGPYPVLSTS